MVVLNAVDRLPNPAYVIQCRVGPAFRSQFSVLIQGWPDVSVSGSHKHEHTFGLLKEPASRYPNCVSLVERLPSNAFALAFLQLPLKLI